MTTSATPRTDRRAGRVLARWQAWTAAAVVAGGVLVVSALPAAAQDAGTEAGSDPVTSSVRIVPEPAVTGGSGSATCAAVAGSDTATWQELRFAALPGVGGSASATDEGVTATVTRLSAGTASFVSTVGVASVVVVPAPGQTTGGATFHYDPPTRGASGVSGRDPASPIGSVLLCLAAPSTSAAAASEAAGVPAIRAATVRARAITRSSVRSAPAAVASPAPALARLPETGTGTFTLVLAGLSLLGLGGAAGLVGRARGVAPDG